ncbi:DUF3581 family protein [Thalassotalea atypica]|uniref:DUF3581 family protein n=1 Tax=Thalassotalea atypica TaxID=2054316 RepID=UPI002572E5C8|nr:DUF3581 family protein [Thalassotalea atypica]
MFIENYYNQSAQKISFTREQASEFAKEIADDFNPLHDIDAKRFCVPGDLLFSVILSQAALHKEMVFEFAGMVSNNIELNFPLQLSKNSSVVDDNQKEYLRIQAEGESTQNKTLIESLIRAYVGFSGHTFPHLLVALMKKHKVMINPARPMVMYESMSLHMKRLDVEKVTLEYSSSTLTIDGKRGNVELAFDLMSNGECIGRGEKHMVLSGLREYCSETMDKVSEQYVEMKDAYYKTR